MVTELAVLDAAVTEKDAVRKFLRCVPEKYDQVAISIETCLGLGELTIEEVCGRLKAAEDRFAARAAKTATAVAGAKLLLTAQDERAMQARRRETGEGSSGLRGGKGGRGRGRGRSNTRGRGGGAGERSGSRKVAKDRCLNCGEFGHWSRDCK